MKKINETIEKNIEKILISFLFIQPIMDVITALFINVLHIETTISSIIRFIFLLFCIYYIVILDKTNNKKKNIIYTVIISIYIILFLITTLLCKDMYVFTYEFKNVLNTFYLPIILISLIDMFKQYKIKFKLKNIIYIYLIYIILIIIPNLTHTGFMSYWHSKVGSVGWFLSANAVGNILSILMPLVILYLIKINKNKIIAIIIVLSSLYVFASMGTKVPILSLIICILTTLSYYVINWLRQKQYKKITIITLTTIIIVILSILLLPKTSFYKNIQIHRDYLGFNSYLEVFTDYELMDHFIFSQRLTFLKNTNQNYKKASITEKLFGIGYIENYGTEDSSTKTVEIDYFDIFYRNGIIGFIIYFSLVIPIIIKKIKESIDKSFTSIQFITTIILILLLALFSGHVLITPAVSIFVALVITIKKGGLYEKIN